MLAGIVAFLDSFFVCFKISMWSEWFTYMFSYSYSYNITVSLVLDRCKCNRNLVFQFYDGFLSYVSLACFCMISSCSYELLCIVWYCNNVFAFCLSGLNLFRPCLVARCKVFENASFYIWSTKHWLITKIITELVCKSRDESNEPN